VHAGLRQTIRWLGKAALGCHACAIASLLHFAKRTNDLSNGLI